ncbi:hypothetical protein TIFTF001_016756 [Ficus carica]|uniref:Uncharacterized protein n=1 Tax=Ficus carica TaxID=3494 RepID=A0AA88DIW7_FICCA|nr:hypothetical protein TIFTF001_016756 [Ficus carica]
MFSLERGSNATVSEVEEFPYMFSTSHPLPAVRGIGFRIYLILPSELSHVLDVSHVPMHRS